MVLLGLLDYPPTPRDESIRVALLSAAERSKGENRRLTKVTVIIVDNNLRANSMTRAKTTLSLTSVMAI